MPAKEKVIPKDVSGELLRQMVTMQTEMRDLQREQNTMLKTAMESILHNAKTQRRDKVIKIIFYGLIIAFSIVSTYYFYSTIGNTLSGVAGFQ